MSTHADPDGIHEARPDGTHVLRYERRLAHPLDRVWRAVTEPDELRGWLADAQIELRQGGAVHLEWLNTDDEGNQAIADGTVARLDPPRLVEYATDLHGVLRFELAPDGEDATRLTFTVEHPGIGDHLDVVLPGWHIHLEHLADALDGRPVDWARWGDEHRPRWQELHDRYAAARA
jgi:uncharacterized protein YndB with AHSA1/START domain